MPPETGYGESQAGAGTQPAKSALPTLGRIVIVDGQPAIVQNVSSAGLLRLSVFGPTGIQMLNTSQQGNGKGEWDWPART